jgi:hypothetical protein
VCHWSLDVTLGEDASRIAEGYAARNLSLLRSVVLTAIKQPVEASVKAGKRKRGLAMTHAASTPQAGGRDEPRRTLLRSPP